MVTACELCTNVFTQRQPPMLLTQKTVRYFSRLCSPFGLKKRCFRPHWVDLAAAEILKKSTINLHGLSTKLFAQSQGTNEIGNSKLFLNKIKFTIFI